MKNMMHELYGCSMVTHSTFSSYPYVCFFECLKIYAFLIFKHQLVALEETPEYRCTPCKKSITRNHSKNKQMMMRKM